jgi:NAD(P)H dehydrogenase (quinone)
LKNVTARILTKLGYCVTVSDLYEDEFKISLERSDYPSFNDPVFSPLAAGGMAYKIDRFADYVRREKLRLEDADLIVFQFPMWWFTCPSMMHAYFERVPIPGWSHYKDKPALRGRKY